MSSEPELPDYYQPGATFSLRLSPNGLLHPRVIRAITPFTMSQVLLVERGEENEKDDSMLSQTLPRIFLAKIYDPRFFAHRLAQRSRPARPWSLEAEAKAAAARDERGMCWDPGFNGCKYPEPGDLPGWEEWYFQNSEVRYHREAAAYRQLQAFQGSVVPHCYGLGWLQLPNRAISPHVLLLEFVPDAKTLALVDLSVVPMSLLQKILDSVDKFGALGVVHTDLNPGNILFSPGYQPTRAVIIDFGEGGVREEEDDLEWDRVVKECADPFWIRRQFRRTGIDLSEDRPSQTKLLIDEANLKVETN